MNRMAATATATAAILRQATMGTPSRSTRTAALLLTHRQRCHHHHHPPPAARQLRHLHQTRGSLRPPKRNGEEEAQGPAAAPAAEAAAEGDDPGTGAVEDELASRPARGRTGGGEPLDSSAAHAPPKPKISNLSVPGVDTAESLTEEQRREVERHNREFREKHDRGETAPGDKVDKEFWSGSVDAGKKQDKEKR